jgi:hypothetical protein
VLLHNGGNFQRLHHKAEHHITAFLNRARDVTE